MYADIVAKDYACLLRPARVPRATRVHLLDENFLTPDMPLAVWSRDLLAGVTGRLRAWFERAGTVNVHESVFALPIGS